MKKFLKSKKFLVIAYCALLLTANAVFTIDKEKFSKLGSEKSIENIELHNVLAYNKSEQEVLYLSDIPYQKAQIGWKTIGLDKTNDNAALVMRIDGSSVVVKKGIWAHATSTVEYEIGRAHV